jgi:hypothetical protein
MVGDFDRARVRMDGSRGDASVSNPVDFLVPPVMGEARVEGA